MNGTKPITTPSLGSMYDGLKTSINSNPLIGATPTGDALHFQLKKNCDHLKDNCYKHILLDVYCKILPLDKDYIDGHMGQMKGDIDAMLQAKGMTPTQYMTSCYNATKAPMLEFVIRSVNNIGSKYMKEAEEEVKDAKENDMDIPVPEAPEEPTDDEAVNDQLVDVKDDIEYDQFVDTLKKKTIDKIVDDVSKIIEDEKETDNMAFDPKPLADVQEEMESTTSIGMNYLQKYLIKEGVDTSNITEELLGYAIRESTLRQFDVVFRQPGTSFREFVSKIRYGKGSIINESAVNEIASKNKTSDEVNGVVDKAKKEMDDKINSKLKASDVIDAKNKNDTKETFESVTFFESKKAYEKLIKAKETISSSERTEIRKRFGSTACSFAKDKDGYYCYTHRCRSKSYKTIADIPDKDVKFVSSTA